MPFPLHNLQTYCILNCFVEINSHFIVHGCQETFSHAKILVVSIKAMSELHLNRLVGMHHHNNNEYCCEENSLCTTRFLLSCVLHKWYGVVNVLPWVYQSTHRVKYPSKKSEM